MNYSNSAFFKKESDVGPQSSETFEESFGRVFQRMNSSIVSAAPNQYWLHFRREKQEHDTLASATD